MHIEILQENLVKALSLVARFVPTKPSIPILANLKISTGENSLIIMANNMEAGIEMKIGVKVIEQGSVVVPAKTLLEFSNLLQPGKIEIWSKDDSLKLKSDKHSAEFPVLNSDEYPEFPKYEEHQNFHLKPEVIQKIVRLILFATSKDEARPVLSAVLLLFNEKNQLRVVGTDGYRLSLLDKLAYDGPKVAERLLVPAKIFMELDRLLKDMPRTDLQVGYSEKQKSLTFEVEGIKIVSRLVEGDYPPFEKIIPKETIVEFNCNKEELLNCVKLAQVFARESSHIIKIKPIDNELVLSSNSATVGKQESVVGGILEGDGVNIIAFNGKFLMDFLQAVEKEKVSIRLSGTLLPGVFAGVDKNFFHVIMPVRTQEASD